MIKRKKKSGKIEIDLSGPQGNAFYILGVAQQLGRQLNKTKEEVDNILNKMQSGDYQNLINIFDKEFGDFVDLYE